MTHEMSSSLTNWSTSNCSITRLHTLKWCDDAVIEKPVGCCTWKSSNRSLVGKVLIQETKYSCERKKFILSRNIWTYLVRYSEIFHECNVSRYLMCNEWDKRFIYTSTVVIAMCASSIYHEISLLRYGDLSHVCLVEKCVSMCTTEF